MLEIFSLNVLRSRGFNRLVEIIMDSFTLALVCKNKINKTDLFLLAKLDQFYYAYSIPYNGNYARERCVSIFTSPWSVYE